MAFLAEVNGSEKRFEDVRGYNSVIRSKKEKDVCGTSTLFV